VLIGIRRGGGCLPGIGAACLRSEMDRIRDGMRGGVSVRRVAFTTALNLLSCTIFSDDLADLDDRGASGEFMAVIEEFPMAVGAPNLSDFFPAIAPLDPQRIRARLVRVFKKLHAIFDEQIERRVQDCVFFYEDFSDTDTTPTLAFFFSFLFSKFLRLDHKTCFFWMWPADRGSKAGSWRVLQRAEEVGCSAVEPIPGAGTELEARPLCQ
jgi:hypothetical protein